MTGDIDPNTQPEHVEPIDADFEPIAEEIKPQKHAGNGPGWLGVGIASLLAAGAGGLIGIKLDQPDTPGAPGADVTSDLKGLQDAQTVTDQKLDQLMQDKNALEARLKDELTALVAAGNGSAELAPLITELEDVSKRLDEAMANAGDPEALRNIDQRLAALEAVDTSGEASPVALQRSVAALTDQVDKLSERLTDTEAALEDAKDIGNDAATQSVQALETELAALRAEISESSDTSEEDKDRIAALVAELSARDAETQKQLDRAETGAEAALALTGIEAASRRGQGFKEDYAKLAAALPGNASLRTLQPLAAKGAPTLAELQSEFATARIAAAKAIDVSDADDGQLSWLNRAFGDAVKVRRKSDDAPAPALQLLQDADNALQSGKLDTAISTLSALQGAPADAMSDWTAQAKSRKALEDGLEALRLDLIGAER